MATQTLTNAVTVTILSEMLVGIYDAPIGGRPQWAIELENDNVAAAQAIIVELESHRAEQRTMSLAQWAWDNRLLVRLTIRGLEQDTLDDVYMNDQDNWTE